MQEEVLSRRLLVFVNNQVYFRCRRWVGDIIEELNITGAPVREWNATGSLYPFMLHPDGGLQDLNKLLIYYARRSLGHESDTLRAAQGMLRQWMLLNRTQMIEGLPFPLDGSLAFRMYQIKAGGNPITRRSGFPSYSWTGWHGELSWDLVTGRRFWPELQTWIQWHLKDIAGICSVDPQGNKTADVYPSSDISLQNLHPFFSNYDIAPEESPTNDFWTNLTYPAIVFWTVCIELRIIELYDRRGYGARGRSGKFCGDMKPDIPDFVKNQRCFCALIAGYSSTRFMALLLKRMPHGGMERWGVAKLSLWRPRWKKIYLV